MIRYANAGDLEQIRLLWEICFPDDSGFNDYFFENLFSLENVLLFEENERIHAMTQMIPRRLKMSSEITEPCTYIYGACTHPDYRRQHLMAQLLERSFVLDRSLGRKASILIPAEPWLFGFYRKFDYLPVFMLNTKEIYVSCSDTQTLSMLSADDIGQISSLYNDLLTDRIPYLVREHTEWKKQIEMFFMLGLGCFGIFAEDGTLDGYAFAWKPDGGVVYIQ
ncbi:MAG: GNAT family N-acetyltransferase, partial [Christensenellaceae bacterium]|nr:GNAT family N-acetyltransferase [Christensenellaceae bacterium]